MAAPKFIQYAPNIFKAVKYEKVWWLKNASAEFGAQAFVLDNYTEGYIPVKSQHKKNGQLWTAVTMKQLEKLVSKNTGLIEIIPPNSKRCVYFDVDMPGVNDPTLTEKCEQAILEYFPGAKMNVSGSFTDVKFFVPTPLRDAFHWSPFLQLGRGHTLYDSIGGDPFVIPTRSQIIHH